MLWAPSARPPIPALSAVLRGSGGALPHLLRGVGRGNHGGTWREQALVMDDAAHALAAIGLPAIPALIDLLTAPDEWARVNAAFALGEMDGAARDAAPALVRALEDESHFVVRTAADALGTIGATEAAEPLGALLHVDRPGWDTPLVRGWSVRDQIRFNAATALGATGPCRRRRASRSDCRPRRPVRTGEHGGAGGPATPGHAGRRGRRLRLAHGRAVGPEPHRHAPFLTRCGTARKRGKRPATVAMRRLDHIAIRSLADLAGGGEGENQMEVFLDLAAGNAAAVVKALLDALPDEPG